MTSTTRPQPLPGLEQRPARIQRMIALLLKHQEAICAGAIGHLELHFHREKDHDAVKAKLVQNLSDS